MGITGPQRSVLHAIANCGGMLLLWRDGDRVAFSNITGLTPSAWMIKTLINARAISRQDAMLTAQQREIGYEAYGLTQAGRTMLHERATRVRKFKPAPLNAYRRDACTTEVGVI